MNVLRRKTRRAIEIWKMRGWLGVKEHTKQLYRKRREEKVYLKWIRKFDTLTDGDREQIRQKIRGFKLKPLISVVMPIYNIEEKWLRLCIESVIKQLYGNWELCIADDHSPSPHVRKVLEEYAAKDKRIKVIFRAENGHISAASNSALELATGEFVALLDHDDELAEHALFYVAEEINRFPETEMIYSDEDMIGENGRRYEPKFKPDWSRDLFYSLNLITHLSVYRTEVLQRIGGFRAGLEGSQDYDLALRVIEQIPENHIRHIPKILYHWRAIRGSVAYSSEEKPYAHERAREAIRQHLERSEKKAIVRQTVYNLHRVQYELPADFDKNNCRRNPK
ncbi:MAG: glycosyltransferase [Acidobacteria bacterium]|nr:glycosyltransferase [Acidobacteriota bacterium]